MDKPLTSLAERARRYTSSGRPMEALALYVKLEELAPLAPEWPYRKAALMDTLGYRTAALQAYCRAAERFETEGDVDRSIELLYRCLELEPEHPDILRALDRLRDPSLELPTPPRMVARGTESKELLLPRPPSADDTDGTDDTRPAADVDVTAPVAELAGDVEAPVVKPPRLGWYLACVLAGLSGLAAAFHLYTPEPAPPAPALAAASSAQAIAPSPSLSPSIPIPAAEAPRTLPAFDCQVQLRTRPAGSEALVFGQVLGTTPLTADVPCGEVDIEFRRARYAPHTETATLSPGAPNRLRVDLRRPRSRLVVRARPAGAKIRVNGRKTRGDLRVPRFQVARITVSKPGFATVTRKLRVKKARHSVAITLKRADANSK